MCPRLFSRLDIMAFLKNQTLKGPLQAVKASICARGARIVQLLALLGALALCGLLVSCGSKTEITPAPPTSQTNAAPSAAAVSPELAKLVGKWERPDGGYIVEIKSVDGTGKLDVGYFNPNPINVSRAAAWRDKGTSKLIIELRDANYPGCIYTLEHNPQSDQLFGQYFQAALQQTFEVVFSRVK
jgi:uncharacterized protein (DUF2147 family)